MIFFLAAFFASADPILSNGALSGNWAMLAIVAALVFFLVRFINQMDKLTAEVKNLRMDYNKLRNDFDNRNTPEYIAGQNARVAEIVYAKIKAITPP